MVSSDQAMPGGSGAERRGLNSASHTVKVGVLNGVRMIQGWAGEMGNTFDQEPDDMSLRPLFHQLDVRSCGLRSFI